MINRDCSTILLNFYAYRISVSNNIIEAVGINIFSSFDKYAEIISWLHIIRTSESNTAAFSIAEQSAITFAHFFTLPAKALLVLLG